MVVKITDNVGDKIYSESSDDGKSLIFFNKFIGKIFLLEATNRSFYLLPITLDKFCPTRL